MWVGGLFPLFQYKFGSFSSHYLHGTTITLQKRIGFMYISLFQETHGKTIFQSPLAFHIFTLHSKHM